MLTSPAGVVYTLSTRWVSEWEWEADAERKQEVGGRGRRDFLILNRRGMEPGAGGG